MTSRAVATGFALIAMFLCVSASARPVSYTGGWTVIETSNRASTAGLLHYTAAYNLSIGARYEWQRGSDTRLKAIQPTFLAKRWFGKDYQGNLYLTGGFGKANRGVDGSSISETASFAGVMADWETRSLFVSYEGRQLNLGKFGNQTMHAARLGWAPYEGDTGAPGDMGCHLMETPFNVLDLGYPDRVECSVGAVYVDEFRRGEFPDGFPPSSHVVLRFPYQNGDFIKLHWMDGGIQPARPEELEPDELMGDGGNGVIIIGDRGKMMCDHPHQQRWKLP